MDDGGGSRYKGLNSTVRKKRSQMLRLPRTVFPEFHDDEYTDDAISRDNRFIGDYSSKKNKEDRATYNNARPIDDTSLRQLADAALNDSKPKKIRLKIGGATYLIETKNSSYRSSGSVLSAKSAQPSDAARPRQNLTPQDNSEDGPLADRNSGSKGISRNNFPGGTFGASKGDGGKIPMESVFEKQGDKPHQNRRMPNRLVLDGLDEDEEEDLLSDGEPGRTKKKEKQMESKREISLTTRQWALLSSGDSSVNLLEFPNGLPPAPPRKQKEEHSEVEKRQKKAEAAQRRKMQKEKAAQESEAEAIRKIRSQDSNRKKQEEKMKQRQEELAQEKAANELAPNTIRTVIGPTGTTVTFSPDIGLPIIFASKPCSYPPPREKCAGPSCENAYKYRDSKSNLPLCSLKCYKAIHEKMQDEKTS
ncbi:uncharacterized protein LOC132051246 [Lycium ferocissimum]|uniref:uncharacterized protein LOC132051246 n=1 Tax=Lycium ferocissimum TaxID=112874 RepID=UPI002815C52A|nr:uncharacterized protein LOC132051246 [Lycium ferocissimum]